MADSDVVEALKELKTSIRAELETIKKKEDHVKGSTLKIVIWTVGILFAVGAGVQTFILDSVKENRDNIKHLEEKVLSMPREIPPLWFKELVYENKKRLDRMDRK